MPANLPLSGKKRIYVISAALLALFLGALDTLIMGAAMPTVVADLGGLELYSWVFSAYLLSRAVCLPLVGKLADLYSTRWLFVGSIALFLIGSLWAGAAVRMWQLIAARVLQGLGAGGNFALVYIVLADIADPQNRGKMMSAASFVWGIASVLGPTMGGLIVEYFSWRWIFYINIPLGIVSFLGIWLFFSESRVKQREAHLDIWGSIFLTASILALLSAFMLAGRRYAFFSWPIIGLLVATLASVWAFAKVEKQAPEPILPVAFFKVRGFAIGNAAVFFSSFAVFAISAFSPVFIQGALGKTPAQLGLAMVPLSLAWSLGALACGQLVHRLGRRRFALSGALLMTIGCILAVGFSSRTSLARCVIMLSLTGLGMGFVSLATLLVVQDSLEAVHLGVTTSAHQFSRTLGGTVGIGITGGLLSSHFAKTLERAGQISPNAVSALDPQIAGRLSQSVENLFRPEIQNLIPAELLSYLQTSVGQGVVMVFWSALAAAGLCLLLCIGLPEKAPA